jgi:tetratricopeptide (TPR) repeat protein
MKKIYIFFASLISILSISAQDYNCTSIPKSKHQQKLDLAISKIYQGMQSKFIESQKIYFSEATEILKSINENHEYPIVNYYLGLTYIYKPDNNFYLAEQYLKKAIDACPDDIPEAYFHLGKLAYTNNDKCEAINYFKRFLSYEGDFDTLLDEARLLLKS